MAPMGIERAVRTCVPVLFMMSSLEVRATRQRVDLNTKNRTLVIYWTRHALSCANLKASSFGGRPRTASSDWPEDDPVLSDCGAYQAHLDGKKIDVPTLDGVFSSSMIRTMQTAHEMYPAYGKVTPLPYISELPNGRDRQDYPMAIADQKAKLAELGIQADFHWMESIAQEHQSVPGSGRVQWEPAEDTQESKKEAAEKAMSQFLDFLERRLLPTLPSKRDLHIAVASHGTFLKMLFAPTTTEGLCRDAIGQKVHNSAVYAVTYDITNFGLKAASCREVFEGTGKPEDICSHDFASCRLEGKQINKSTGRCLCKPASDWLFSG